MSHLSIWIEALLGQRKGKEKIIVVFTPVIQTFKKEKDFYLMTAFTKHLQLEKNVFALYTKHLDHD